MTRDEGLRFGRVAWSILGVAGVAVVLGLVLRALSVAVVPIVLALFPATLLVPVVRRLESWRFPPALASLVTLTLGLLLFLGIAAGVVTLVVQQIPDVVDSAGEGIDRVEELVGRVVPGFEVPAMDELREMILERVQRGAEGEGEGGGVASRAWSMASSAVELMTSLALLVVVLFFYLKDGRRLAEGFAGFVAPRSRDRIMGFADEAWETLDGYFKGQLLVALVDAVFIGIGLLILGVPLALPLSVIVFFGGLFPIIGAFLTGTLAVLVGFSDGGLGVGLAVLGVVILVQQLESNVLEPLIISQAIDLEPLAVILAITVGAILLGVLGAFLAVPVVAVTKQVVARMRHSAVLTEDA